MCPQTHLIEFKTFSKPEWLGKVIEGKVEVKKALFGGSNLVEIKNDRESVVGFLHKSHLDTSIDKIKKMKIKEINYLEHQPIFTAIHSEVEKISTFNDVQVGQIYNGVVTKFIKNPLQIVVQLAENVTGTVDSLNFNDTQQIRVLPKSNSLN